MSKTLHFKSKAGYRRWLAFGHIHGQFKRTPGNKKIVIRGKAHKVKHTRR